MRHQPTVLFVLQVALCAVSPTAARGQSETRQGIEQAEDTHETEAKACEGALRAASLKAESELVVHGLYARRKGITSKKCECRENPKPKSNVSRWGCIGLVSWEATK